MSEQPSRGRRWGLATLATLVVLVLVGAAIFRLRPVAVLEVWTAVRLRWAGVEVSEQNIGGRRIRYLAQGPRDGKPVVLVHGLGDRAEHWGAFAKYVVAAGFRVYTPDLLGYGKSDKPHDAEYSVAEEAQVVLGFMDALGLKQVDLGGWSMGGWVAQEIALAHPERIRRLILLDSAGLKQPPSWDVKLFTPKSRDQFAQFLALLSPHPKQIPGFIVDDVIRTHEDTDWVIERSLASMLTGRDATDEKLPTLAMPVLILWGSLDQVTPPSEAEAMHHLIPHSELTVIDGCGHLAPSECAAQMGPRAVQFLN